MKDYWINNTYFGNTPFRYTGSGKELFIKIFPWIAAIVGSLPVLFTVMGVFDYLGVLKLYAKEFRVIFSILAGLWLVGIYVCVFAVLAIEFRYH